MRSQRGLSLLSRVGKGLLLLDHFRLLRDEISVCFHMHIEGISSFESFVTTWISAFVGADLGVSGGMSFEYRLELEDLATLRIGANELAWLALLGLFLV